VSRHQWIPGPSLRRRWRRPELLPLCICTSRCGCSFSARSSTRSFHEHSEKEIVKVFVESYLQDRQTHLEDLLAGRAKLS
jgi:hypothetical protein